MDKITTFSINNYRFLNNEKAQFDLSIQDLQQKLEAGAGTYIPKFSFFQHKKWNTPPIPDTSITILSLIDYVKNHDGLKLIAAEIKKCHEKQDEVGKGKAKASLPYITPGGVFTTRVNADLIYPSFVFQLDIDKIKNPPEILEKIIHDDELDVLIATVSPSGNGVKALLQLPTKFFLPKYYNFDVYRNLFFTVTDIYENHFVKKYKIQIDTQMKSISQPLFLSHFPDLYVNPKFL